MIHNCDCLEFLESFGCGEVDAVICDPPYMINTKSDGKGKLNPWADLMNAAAWYKQWIGEAKRILKPTGCLWTFLNWRSMATFQKVSCDLRWPISSVLVWDKGWIGPGGAKGLRPSYEMVALFAMPEFRIENRSLADVQRFKWASYKPTGHPAEKPQQLLEFLVENSTNPGDLVLDCFAGSGTTAAACVNTGRRFEGCEIDEEWVEYGNDRVERAELQKSVELELAN